MKFITITRITVQTFSSNHNSDNFILLIRQPFKIKACRAEINQESDFEVVGFQIVDALCQVYRFKRNECLNFNTNNLFYEEVYPPSTDVLSLVVNWHFYFPAEVDTRICEFDGQGSLIDNFLKTIAQKFVYTHGTPDYVRG